MLLCGTDDKQKNKQLNIELLSQWKLEAEFRNKKIFLKKARKYKNLPGNQLNVRLTSLVHWGKKGGKILGQITPRILAKKQFNIWEKCAEWRIAWERWGRWGGRVTVWPWPTFSYIGAAVYSLDAPSLIFRWEKQQFWIRSGKIHTFIFALGL